MSMTWEELVKKENPSDAEKVAMAAVIDAKFHRASHLSNSQIFDRLLRVFDFVFIDGTQRAIPRGELLQIDVRADQNRR